MSKYASLFQDVSKHHLDMVCGRHSSSVISSKCASMLHRELFLLIDYYDDYVDSNYTFVDKKFS